MSDMARRWREAKLGERRGSRVCVWVECEGDPRAEVLEALDEAERRALMPGLTGAQIDRLDAYYEAQSAEAWRPESGEPAEHVVTDVDRETGIVTIASPPKRKRAKRSDP